MDAFPTSTKFALSSGDYRLATRVKLGCSMPLSSHLKQCECGRRLFHLLTCKTGGGPVWSHNAITGVWADCLRTLSIPHHVELRDRYANSNDRPDISVFDACIETSYDLDISLAHPWNQDIIERAAEQDGFAAQAREELKEKKYKDNILVEGGHAKVIPLVLEHFGCLGWEAHKYLHQLSKKSVDEFGKKNGGQFKKCWRRCLSVALQSCNAKVLSKKISRQVKNIDRQSDTSCSLII